LELRKSPPAIIAKPKSSTGTPPKNLEAINKRKPTIRSTSIAAFIVNPPIFFFLNFFLPSYTPQRYFCLEEVAKG
jgi:hypothetical protein